MQYSTKDSGPGNGGGGGGTISATYTPPRVPTPSGQNTGGNAPGSGGAAKTRGGIGRLATGRKGRGK